MRISDWSSDVCSSDLKQYGLAVTVADTSKFALRGARKQDLEVHRGDVLDEATQDQLDMGRFQQVIAATENDAYNALVWLLALLPPGWPAPLMNRLPEKSSAGGRQAG